MKGIKQKKWISCIVIVFFLSFFVLFWNTYNLINTPLIPRSGAPKLIRIPPSSSAYQFTRLLEKQGMHSPRIFLLIIRCAGLSRQLKAGLYQVHLGETALQLLHRVVAGEVLIQNFVVIEGSTQKKIAEDLMKAQALEYHPEDWLVIKEKYRNAEGLLLADTYQYQGGASSLILLEQAHQHLLQYLNKAWTNRLPGLPYQNAYELLIAASIIEKETALVQEKVLISGVMVNRLRKKMPLQMDPTVIYGLGKDFKGRLSHQDMQMDSPYNSYRYRGLPPTPIAMVGKESIDAAAHPQLSNYIYFVARGDGSHQFSETYEQQKKAIRQYQHKDF